MRLKSGPEHPLAGHEEEAFQPKQYRRRDGVLKSGTMPEVVLAAPAPDFGRLDNADEGFVPFRPGDYVVTESVPGEAWVIERYAFEASYERIP